MKTYALVNWKADSAIVMRDGVPEATVVLAAGDEPVIDRTIGSLQSNDWPADSDPDRWLMSSLDDSFADLVKQILLRRKVRWMVSDFNTVLDHSMGEENRTRIARSLESTFTAAEPEIRLRFEDEVLAEPWPKNASTIDAPFIRQVYEIFQRKLMKYGEPRF